MPKVDINGLNINYEFEGDGKETIVLINGLADDLGTWSEQMPDLLAAGYSVLRFDNRGIGNTDWPEGAYTTKEMAADCKGLVDHLGLTNFHLVGVSMGGMIAQEYALAYGADLKSLSLCCTYAAPGPFCSRMFSVWRDMAPVMGPAEIMRDVTLWAFTLDFFNKREPELRAFEKDMAALNQTSAAYLSQLNSIETHDTRDRLSKIETPTMVLAGANDILIPVELSKELHAGISNAEWKTSIGGHAFLWEYPKEFNAALLGFLETHRAKRLRIA